jgi:hypothetical protein
MSDLDDVLARLAAVEQELERQKDLRAIEDLLARYSRALDWLDDAMLDTVFYDDAEIDYGFFKGSGKDFKPRLMEVEHSVGRRWHFTSQLKMDLDGDVAEVESYNLSLSLPGETPADKAPYAIFFGFYKDRVLKRGGKWGIIARKHILVAGAPLAEIAMDGDMGMLNQIGMTGPSHPDYRKLTKAQTLDAA